MDFAAVSVANEVSPVLKAVKLEASCPGATTAAPHENCTGDNLWSPEGGVCQQCLTEKGLTLWVLPLTHRGGWVDLFMAAQED